jgi:hypothetical protein
MQIIFGRVFSPLVDFQTEWCLVRLAANSAFESEWSSPIDRMHDQNMIGQPVVVFESLATDFTIMSD